jgi:hypothetical protein
VHKTTAKLSTSPMIQLTKNLKQNMGLDQPSNSIALSMCLIIAIQNMLGRTPAEGKISEPLPNLMT